MSCGGRHTGGIASEVSIGWSWPGSIGSFPVFAIVGDRPARDCDPLAPCRVQSLLAVEIEASRSLVEMLARNVSPAVAVSSGHISTITPDHADAVVLEAGTPAIDLKDSLEKMGCSVKVGPMMSGLGFVKRTSVGWIGAADPRRDGASLGERERPLIAFSSSQANFE
jgi:Gamma-glutamyltranspeptidase